VIAPSIAKYYGAEHMCLVTLPVPAGKGKERQSVGPTHTEASTMERSMEDLQTGEDMHKLFL
jgi:hypothetical protein